MNRRSFLQTIAGALIAARLALEFGAQKPGYAGFEFVQDPMPIRYVFRDGAWRRAPDNTDFGEEASISHALFETLKRLKK